MFSCILRREGEKKNFNPAEERMTAACWRTAWCHVNKYNLQFIQVFCSVDFSVHTKFILFISCQLVLLSGAGRKNHGLLYWCNHLTSGLATYCKVQHSILNIVLQWFLGFFVLFFFFFSYCKSCSFCNCRDYFVLRVNKYIWTTFGLWGQLFLDLQYFFFFFFTWMLIKILFLYILFFLSNI